MLLRYAPSTDDEIDFTATGSFRTGDYRYFNVN